MKKKILIGLLAIIALFTVSGCGKKVVKNEEKKEKKIAYTDPEVKVGETSVVLNTDAKIGNMSFKHPSVANAANYGTYALFDQMDSGRLLYRVVINYYENKKEYEVMEGTSLEQTFMTEINKVKWAAYEGKEDDRDVTVYVYTKDYDTYTITFLSDYDIKEFIGAFMSTVEF